MAPSLFVMWDKTIRPRGDSYGTFTERMHRFARKLRDDLAPAAARTDLEGYLQVQLRYPVRKTLAKYIDEYNWYLAFGHARQQ